MTLNASGPISLAGATTGQSIAVELGVGTTTQISLNCTNVRTLAGVPTGAIVMPTNFWGKSASIPFGCATYTTPGTYSFVVPAGATKICVVCVGGGMSGFYADCDCSAAGGIGGGLSYTNCIATTPGETLTVVVGAGGTSTGACPFGYNGGQDSAVKRGATNLVLAKGGGSGSGATCINVNNQTSGVGAVKYNGGNLGLIATACQPSGGGGAAGFSGNGGKGGGFNNRAAGAGAGGGGGGGGGSDGSQGRDGTSGAGGGGVGLVVQGSNGTAGTNNSTGALRVGGGGGSGGAAGTNNSAPRNSAGTAGGAYGGAGGGGAEDCGLGGAGGKGGVRIIYGGTNKNYPNNSAP